MPLLHASNMTFRFANGEVLFESLSFRLQHRRVGIVGRNGSGKSVLLSLITGERLPFAGHILREGSVAQYRQLPSDLLTNDQTIAQFLKLDVVIDALNRVENGCCDPADFEAIGDQWLIREELAQQLAQLKLPNNPDHLCKYLSGGQLARLQLWRLFQHPKDLLLLDEPSNHLDSAGKAWLLAEMARYSGVIILVSHDRALLKNVDQIWELSRLGLQQYIGNYDVYRQQKAHETAAVERQLLSIKNQQKQLERQAQRDHEKAQRRAAQGVKLRREGSQAKLLLNGMRNSAERSVGARRTNEQVRRTMLAQQANQVAKQVEQLKPQSMSLGQGVASRNTAVSLINAQLPHGSAEPVHITCSMRKKLHLSGGNGCGKSTLLKVLLGDVELLSGEKRVNVPLFYLDQHFDRLLPEQTLLDNLSHYCPHLCESEVRTQLAGIGFRRDAVWRLVKDVSGGEKMKLAMLIVTHQATHPFLLLDEPDNHLDLDSKLMLASALNRYQGGFILVSHDEAFVKECGVDEQYLL